MNQKGLVPILIVLLLAIGALGGGYFAYHNSRPKPAVPSPEPIFCTQDAKQCPDGSFVGRSGPKCEFAPCPTLESSPSAETANWKTYITSKFTFRHPLSFIVEERVKDYFVIVPSGITPAPQQGISIDSRLEGSLTDFDTAVNEAKENLIDMQTKNMNNGVVISGKVGSGFGEGLPVTTAILHYKQGAISIEYTSITQDPTADSLIFNQILSTFKFIQ